MRGFPTCVAAGAFVVLSLSGCGAGPEPDLRINCDDHRELPWPQYTDFRQAWSDRRTWCDVQLQSRPRTAIEASALLTAYGDYGDDEGLETLYGLCAASGSTRWSFLMYAPRPSPVRQEMRGVLVLCPDHPDAALIKQLNE